MERETNPARSSSNHSSPWAGPGTGVGVRDSERGGEGPEPDATGGALGIGSRADWPRGGWRDSANGCPGWDATACRMAALASRDNPGSLRVRFVLTPRALGPAGSPPTLNPGWGAPE